MEKKISPAYWLIALAALGITWILPGLASKDGQKYLAPPPEHMQRFHFGFADALSDSLWLRWIQDSDYCQTYKGAAPANPIQATKTGDFVNPRHKFCDNSWSFKMLDAITHLAPKFRMPYATGALTLSVMVEDYEGAKVIFDRGLEIYPNDWDLLYQASYHYLFDRRELETAAKLLERARANGGPWWFTLLASRLYSKTGKIEMGIKTLERYRTTLNEQYQIDEVDKRIKDLKTQLNSAE